MLASLLIYVQMKMNSFQIIYLIAQTIPLIYIIFYRYLVLVVEKYDYDYRYYCYSYSLKICNFLGLIHY